MRAVLIAVFLGLFPALAVAGGLGHYRFGMTVDQVKAVKGCGDYKPIGDGDVECPAYPIGGKTYNLSFHFADGKLHKMQLWFAEGTTRPKTEAAVDDLIAFLSKTHGKLISNALPAGAPVTRAALFKALDAQTDAEDAKVQLKPRKDP